MFATNGHLFLFFSGGGYLGTTYGMGVAVCGSISGPCRQQGDQPILSSTDTVAGPGGGTAFFDRYGHPWLAYAAWNPTAARPGSGSDPELPTRPYRDRRRHACSSSARRPIGRSARPKGRFDLSGGRGGN